MNFATPGSTSRAWGRATTHCIPVALISALTFFRFFTCEVCSLSRPRSLSGMPTPSRAAECTSQPSLTRRWPRARHSSQRSTSSSRRACATFFRHLCDRVVIYVNLTTVAPCRQARNAMPPKEIPMPFTIDIYLAAFSAILLAGWGVSTWLWSRREQAQKQQLATLAGQLRAREEQVAELTAGQATVDVRIEHLQQSLQTLARDRERLEQRLEEIGRASCRG